MVKKEFEELYKKLEGKKLPTEFYASDSEKYKKDYVDTKLEELWYNFNKIERKIEAKYDKYIKTKRDYVEAKKVLSKEMKEIKKQIEVFNDWK